METNKYGLYFKLDDEGLVRYYAAGEMVNGKLNGIVYGYHGGNEYADWYVFQNKILPSLDNCGEMFESDQMENLLDIVAKNKHLVEESNKIIGQYLRYKEDGRYYPKYTVDSYLCVNDLIPVSYANDIFGIDEKEMTLDEFIDLFDWKSLAKDCLQSQIDMDQNEEEPLSSGTLIENAIMSLLEDVVYEGIFSEEVIREYLEKIVDAIETKYAAGGYCCEDYALANVSIVDCEICEECEEVLFPNCEAYSSHDGRILCQHCSIRCENCEQYFVSGEIVQDKQGNDVCKKCLSNDANYHELIGKRVVLTKEFKRDYYFDYPYADIVTTVVAVKTSYKSDDVKKEFGYERVILKDDDGNVYDDDIEIWGVEEVKEQSVWLLEQYDVHFSYSSRVLFGAYDSYEKAKKALIGFEELYPGFVHDIYNNGYDNQWITDKFDFGVMITEVEKNTFGEI